MNVTELLFGEETGLINLWEEICAQRQGEESVAWDVYEQTVDALIEAHLEDLSESARRVIWLSTDKGLNRQYGDEFEEGVEPPVSERDIVENIAEHYVYSRAAHFSNNRIDTFLNRLP